MRNFILGFVFLVICNTNTFEAYAQSGMPDNSNTPMRLNPDELFDVQRLFMSMDSSHMFAQSFYENFRCRVGVDNPFDSNYTYTAIPVEAIRNLRSLVSVSDSESAGLWIQYGLNTELEPVCLFSPVKMKMLPSSTPASLLFEVGTANSYYKFENGTEWGLAENFPILFLNYKLHMVKKNGAGLFEPIDIQDGNPASDPRAVFFPLVELDSLIDNTQRAIDANTWEPVDCRPNVVNLVFRWSAEPIGLNGELLHSVAIIPQLDGYCLPGPGSNFVLRAANFNNPCPPHCSNVSYMARLSH